VLTSDNSYQKDLITELENNIAALNAAIENYKRIELERDGLLIHKEALLQQIAGLQNDKANLEARVAELEAALADLTRRHEDLT